MNAGDPAAVRATMFTQYLFNQLFLDAVTYGLEDRDFDGRFDGPHDRFFDPAIAGRLDYIGLNYYAPSIVVPLPTMDLYPLIGVAVQSDLDLLGFMAPKTEVGWAIYPQGLREVIQQIEGYGLPIVITENGIADGDDDQRPRFLADHLYVVAQAFEAGVDIRGYFHWSLTDNFEWASGYCPRFGLFHVDYASPSRTRTPGAGALTYRKIIAANTVPTSLFAKYPTYPAPTNNCSRQREGARWLGSSATRRPRRGVPVACKPGARGAPAGAAWTPGNAPSDSLSEAPALQKSLELHRSLRVRSCERLPLVGPHEA